LRDFTSLALKGYRDERKECCVGASDCGRFDQPPYPPALAE
jgi:hypothetical protein